MDSEAAAVAALLRRVAVPAPDVVHLVREQLLVDGHHAAAAALLAGNGSDRQPAPARSVAERRVAVRDAVNRGDVPSALRLLDESWPRLLGACPALAYRLHQQHVLDLVQRRRWDDGWRYAAAHLAPLARVGATPDVAARHGATCALFAYPEPAPPALPRDLAALLSPEHRSGSAHAAYAAVLAADGEPTEARLPRLLERALADAGGLGAEWALALDRGIAPDGVQVRVQGADRGAAAGALAAGEPGPPLASAPVGGAAAPTSGAAAAPLLVTGGLPA